MLLLLLLLFVGEKFKILLTDNTILLSCSSTKGFSIYKIIVTRAV